MIGRMWVKLADNGFILTKRLLFPDKQLNVIELSEAVTARYVRMQGIQRREKNNDNNTDIHFMNLKFMDQNGLMKHM